MLRFHCGILINPQKGAVSHCAGGSDLEWLTCEVGAQKSRQHLTRRR
jgi:hypothetical protein